ncbi:hypothetical protein NQ317_019895 [Molorchus minor]|uniref:F-box domain-containing protein n=1 Tax=Molorchus minor TaxID=1323400 RepID=A0ABQ9J8A4_9CUCU|nr:hypothetical protein NQ317_019895 [Molorchus minor]
MDQLPLELLWKVLGYLSTYDLVQFCRAYGDNKPLKEKRLIQLVDFSRRFELHNFNLCHFIKTDLNYSYIKCLNVSYLHWIPADELRKLIKQLENLHTLLAIDSKLGLKDKDISGYIKIYDDNKSSNRIDYSQLVCMLKNLKSLLSNRELYYHISTLNVTIFSTFGCKRSDTATEIIFEDRRKVEDSNRSIFDPRNGNELENSWDIFQTLLKDLPYGPKESKVRIELYLHNDINSINFEELNFCHSIIVCNYKYVTGARIILLSKNASKLKRLSFRSCLLQDFSLMNMTTDEHLSFKKPRIGVQMNTNIIHHPFLPVANNVKCIEVLEIENCPWCAGSAVIASYPIISAFENLRKLTLEVPILINGLFLKRGIYEVPAFGVHRF